MGGEGEEGEGEGAAATPSKNSSLNAYVGLASMCTFISFLFPKGKGTGGRGRREEEH